MTIKPVKTGWQVNIQPGGRGAKRLKKTFPTKAEALAWERHIRAKVQLVPDWTPAKRDARQLSDLIDLWFRHHGSGLRDGIRRKRILLAMSDSMGNPRAELMSADMFAEYRAQQITGGIQPNTMNRRLAYLRAMFNELIRIEHWKKENPLKKLRAFKLQERELSYLRREQMLDLFESLEASNNEHALLISKVCLATGARWSEGENLRLSQLQNNRIQFSKTKSGKLRAVPIHPNLCREIEEHSSKYGEGDRILGLRERVWVKTHANQIFGNMQVSTFSRRYSSSRSPYARRWMTRILLLSPSTKPSETLFSGLQYAAIPSQ